MSGTPRIRCALYTRKSSEEGLEQGFNSLDAQREACEAYVASQRHEGWVALANRYDDGGVSGGTLERPGLQRLLADIGAGRIDRVVVYKVDRLTRSLTDFARLVERLDGAGCSFVSVTQSFNTATSMGRLTLNMLLSFAQFEREVTAERIRDKLAASKRRGLWMGGPVPLGYDAQDRTLAIKPAEAATVEALFGLYERLGCVRRVKAEADRQGLLTKRRRTRSGKATGGVPFSRGRLYHLLANPLYAGFIRHKDALHPGRHPAIIEPDRWRRVQAQLRTGAARHRGRETAASPSPLAGKLVDETGDRLTPSHTRKAGRRYRYYVSRRLIAASGEAGQDGWRLPAQALEEAVCDLLKSWLAEPMRPAHLAPGAPVSGIAALRTALDTLSDALDGPAAASHLAALIEAGTIAPGTLTITLSAPALAQQLGRPMAPLSPAALTLSGAFTLRHRGVEARIVLEQRRSRMDQTLLKAVVQGHAWMADIKQGTGVAAIAKREGLSRHRITQLLDLAFLAPDIVEAITQGTQPADLTASRLIKSPIPVRWSEQRTQLRTT